ncbi:hypothetical protein BJV82DRAFT_582579 [Fennellomyces sp. T-0311]|nr:hypothetical protein BJV82DRAFT_582579 [Fennellomyces sp. T-0311]
MTADIPDSARETIMNASMDGIPYVINNVTVYKWLSDTQGFLSAASPPFPGNIDSLLKSKVSGLLSRLTPDSSDCLPSSYLATHDRIASDSVPGVLPFDPSFLAPHTLARRFKP